MSGLRSCSPSTEYTSTLSESESEFFLDLFQPGGSGRTETPDQAKKSSLLSYLPQNISQSNLDEAFCRDLEAFDELFQVRLFKHKPILLLHLGLLLILSYQVKTT